MYATETVSAGETMSGTWTSGTQTPSEHSVTVVNKTYYDANDGSCTSVEQQLTDGTLAFTVQTRKSAYTHLVQVQLGESEIRTVTPGTDGTYTVTGVNDDVIITVISVLKGDANLDGSINNMDMVRMRKYILKSNSPKDDFEKLAADINASGGIDNLDFIRLRKFILKNIPEL